MSKDSVNRDVIEAVSQRHKVSPSQVEEFFKVVCEFSTETIQKGAFETIMLPNFGKLRPKVKQIQYFNAIGKLK